MDLMFNYRHEMTMNREQIEKAANIEMLSHYADEEYPCGIKDIQSDFIEAFSKGAQWRINSVWHNKHTVIPDAGRPALLELKDPDSQEIVYKMDSYSGYEWKELTHYEIAGLIRFAYIDDLLPERKEETNGGR